VFIHALHLDGDLRLSDSAHGQVHVGQSSHPVVVRNKGSVLETVDVADASVPERLRIRGYRIVQKEVEHISESPQLSLFH
jgi:hypothetical protein